MVLVALMSLISKADPVGNPKVALTRTSLSGLELRASLTKNDLLPLSRNASQDHTLELRVTRTGQGLSSPVSFVKTFFRPL